MQELIYNLNVPSRWGTQTPFTNLTFDWVCPDDLREQIPVIGGEEMPFAYGDLQAEMDLINRAYIEVMRPATPRAASSPSRSRPTTSPRFRLGQRERRPAVRDDRALRPAVLPELRQLGPQPNMMRSMCCRLQLDLRELLKRGNGLFGSAEQTGSLGVVTINCARLGYLFAGDEAALLARLDRLLDWPRQPGDQAQGDPAPDGRRACSPTPSATWARCATTSPRWA
jgi:ribonucleoside-triphosphate reductase